LCLHGFDDAVIVERAYIGAPHGAISVLRRDCGESEAVNPAEAV
jgi:hypothetical protein